MSITTDALRAAAATSAAHPPIPGQQIEVRRPAEAGALSDVPGALDEQMRLSRALATSGLIPRHLQGRPDNVLVVLMGARALNIAAFTAFQHLHVVEGKLGQSADLMRALVIKNGHRFRVVESTAETATVQIVRWDDPDFAHEATFTLDEAKTAGLVRPNSNWTKYAADMLIARATSRVARRACSDIMGGVVYTPDELRELPPTVESTGYEGRPIEEHTQGTPESTAPAPFVHHPACTVTDTPHEGLTCREATTGQPDTPPPANVDTTTGEVTPDVEDPDEPDWPQTAPIPD